LEILNRLYHDLPSVMRIACGALAALALGLGGWMWWESRRAIGMLRTFHLSLADVPPLEKTERRHGVPLSAVETLRSRCDELPNGAKHLWNEIDQHVERYTSPEGVEGWFLTVAPRTILTEEAVIGPYYHASFHQAVPGILTASGLLLTFVSILLALVHVTVGGSQGAETVTGTKELINGLSAKFVSSILGLLLSIIFVLAERKACGGSPGHTTGS